MWGGWLNLEFSQEASRTCACAPTLLPSPLSPLPSLRKFSGSAHDPAILVHYIYLYFVLKIILPVTTKLENFESSVSRSLSPGLRLQSHIHCRMFFFFFFGSFTCLRWCGESLLPLFVHFITAYWRRLARRSNFGAYEL